MVILSMVFTFWFLFKVLLASSQCMLEYSRQSNRTHLNQQEPPVLFDLFFEKSQVYNTKPSLLHEYCLILSEGIYSCWENPYNCKFHRQRVLQKIQRLLFFSTSWLYFLVFAWLI